MNNCVFEYLPQFHYLCNKNCICQMVSFQGCNNSHQYMNYTLKLCVLLQNRENGWLLFVQRKIGDLLILTLSQNVKVKTLFSPPNAWKINRKGLDNKKM